MTKCKNCKFFQLNKDDKKGVGECRKYTPKSPNRFPQVKRDDWCGEYEVEVIT